MTRHSFSGAATPTTLSAGINSTVTTIPVNALTGTWPNTGTGPFVVTLDRGSASEEKILVPSYSSTQFTSVTRGYDGTSGVSHSNGATVEHTLDAAQIDLHDSVVAGVGTSTPSTSAVGDSASDGTATTTPAAGDHKHGREAFSTPGNSAVGDVAAAGSATTIPRSDHKHGRESFYSSVGAPSTSAGAVGSSTSPAHGDHVHRAGGQLVGVSSYAPGTQNVITTTSGAWSEVNAALRTTFTAPASGEVLVRLSATVGVDDVGGGAGTDVTYTWAIANVAGTTKYGPSAMVGGSNFNGGTFDIGEATTAAILVTGLTPGTSYTFAWFHVASVAAVWDILAADDGGVISPYTAPSYKGGPAVMEVWAV